MLIERCATNSLDFNCHELAMIQYLQHQHYHHQRRPWKEINIAESGLDQCGLTWHRELAISWVNGWECLEICGGIFLDTMHGWLANWTLAHPRAYGYISNISGNIVDTGHDREQFSLAQMDGRQTTPSEYWQTGGYSKFVETMRFWGGGDWLKERCSGSGANPS